ncbi:hypothetical protein BJ508DRAFT_334930 [Ascobolus immersus RN42]|uniref:Uncharacterized protein n=1 Tax=Ascobolus immersus RN42 TaxID=1160509 RepID=A0A3N4HIP7_ASCIM|nr:hypothetical protein BJ508DRAFT_334930 [Ascobolus immersus RN42]
MEDEIGTGSYFPDVGPFFAPRYNPACEEDIKHFKSVLRTQSKRLEAEIRYAERKDSRSKLVGENARMS